MSAEAKAFWKIGDFKMKHVLIKLHFCSGINLITNILFWILLKHIIVDCFNLIVN
jgi:hypothetical protein